MLPRPALERPDVDKRSWTRLGIVGLAHFVRTTGQRIQLADPGGTTRRSRQMFHDAACRLRLRIGLRHFHRRTLQQTDDCTDRVATAPAQSGNLHDEKAATRHQHCRRHRDKRATTRRNRSTEPKRRRRKQTRNHKSTTENATRPPHPHNNKTTANARHALSLPRITAQEA